MMTESVHACEAKQSTRRYAPDIHSSMIRSWAMQVRTVCRAQGSSEGMILAGN
jgi:hypothetical protein